MSRDVVAPFVEKGGSDEELVTAQERSELRRQSNTRLPLALVTVALASLIVVPLLVQHRTETIQTDISKRAEPARQLIGVIQSALALQVAGARGYVLTGEQDFAVKHRQAQAQRRHGEAQLYQIARGLSPQIARDVSALTGELRLADARLDSLFEGRLSRREYQTRLKEQQAHLEAAIEQTSRLDQALRRIANNQRLRIQANERAGVVLTVVLVVLALVAALLVSRLGRGYRSLALRLDESEARFRRAAEREHAAWAEAVEARQTADRRRSEVERVTESRTRLIRGFTHDVKNPLGAADGFMALLEDGIYGDLTAPQKHSIGKARRSIRTALDLIRQLLELAQAEAGQLQLRRATMDMRVVAQEVEEDFHAQAEAAGLTLGIELPAEAPTLDSDPDRARQILANLVSNAIKYTPRGGRVIIRVVTRSDRSSTPGDWIVVEVSDTGLGIPSDKQEMLFLEFTRFDPTAAEGAGIGLAISQRIAHALGGEIRAESTVGTGSTFALWLPLPAPPPSQEPGDSRERGHSAASINEGLVSSRLLPNEEGRGTR